LLAHLIPPGAGRNGYYVFGATMSERRVLGDDWTAAGAGKTVASETPSVNRDVAAQNRRLDDRDRRNHAARAALVERFREEFRVRPGMWVTPAEARRLFGTPDDICERVLDRLVEEGLLIRSADGIYRRPPTFVGRRW
jgi:hypothetical protein